MPGKPKQPSKIKAEKTDDFKLIEGINEAIDTRLKEREITTFSRLAAFSPTDIDQAISNIQKVSRTEIETWIRRAGELARASQRAPVLETNLAEIDIRTTLNNPLTDATPTSNANLAEKLGDFDEPVVPEPLKEALVETIIAPDLNEPAPLEPGSEVIIPGVTEEPFATVLLKFYLNANGEVSQTQITHHQSQLEQRWDGWDVARLEDFLTRQVQLQLREPKTDQATVLEVQYSPVVTTYSSAEEAEDFMKKLVTGEIRQEGTITGTPEQPETYTAIATSTKTRAGGKTQLNDLRLGNNVMHDGPALLTSARPYTISMLLNLSDLPAREEPLRYTATVYAKRLGGERRIVGETSGLVMPPNQVAIEMQGSTLSSGHYHLEAIVLLNETEADTGMQPGYVAWSEMGLVEVS